MNQLLEDFQNDGYVIIKNAITLKTLNSFEDTIIRVCSKLLNEINTKPNQFIRANKHSHYLNKYNKLQTLCKEDPKRFYLLCSNIGASLEGLRLFQSPKLRQALRTIAGVHSGDLFPMPWNIFYNQKGVTRLAYDLHQESVAFPTVQTTYHIWTPLFHSIRSENGPLVVLRGSHKEVFPYQAVEAKDSVTQLHIDPKLLEKFKRVECNFDRGTAILFHHNLVHGTGTNTSEKPRIACSARFLDLKNNTLNPNFEPYVQYYFSSKESRKAVDEQKVIKSNS